MIGKITFAFLLCIIVFTTACNRGKPSEPVQHPSGMVTEIGGILEDGAGHNVVLEEMAAREFIPVDTVTCDDHGVFYIRFEPDRLAFYVLRIGPTGYITLLIEPGERISFEGSYGETDQYRLEGSEGSELLKVISAEHKRTLDELGRVTRKNMEFQSSPDYPELKAELDRQFDSITAAFHGYSLDFIKRNPESLAILIALYNLYGQGLHVLHPREDQDV